LSSGCISSHRRTRSGDSPGRALALVIITAALGYLFGGLIGVIRNCMNASQRGA
jgi:hypothetical protein